MERSHRSYGEAMRVVMIYFEDLEVGAEDRVWLSYEVTREEVLEFARKYDPQPFPLLSDEEAAQDPLSGASRQAAGIPPAQ